MSKYDGIDFNPPDGVKAAYRRGIKLHEDGKSGDGIEAATVAMARKLASGESVSPEWARKAYRFWSRNERFLDEVDTPAYTSAMLWGGRPGLSWYRKLYKQMESREMKKNKVILFTNVDKTNIKDTGTHWEISGFPVTVDGAIMNRVLYPAEHNKRGLPDLIGKPVALGHPVDADGNNISARIGEGLEDYFSGGTVTNAYNKGGVNYADCRIKKSVLEAQEKGEWYVNALNNKDPIGVSTGLFIAENSESGDGYDMVARDQSYDHVAMLDDSDPPAGGDNTFMRFNAESSQAMIVNVADHLPTEEISDTLINKITNAVKAVFASERSDQYTMQDRSHLATNDNKTSQEVIMDREAMLKALKKKGYEVNEGITDDELMSMMAKNLADYAKEPEKAPEGNQDLEALKNQVEALTNAIQARDNDEKAELAEQVAALDIGVDSDSAKAMSVNSLKSVLAKNGVSNFRAGVTMQHNAKEKGTIADMPAPWEKH